MKLRQNLKYFVDSVEYYMQVDVIEAEFMILRKRINETTDFEKIIQIHADLLGELLTKCFIATAINKEYDDVLYQTPTIKTREEDDKSVFAQIVKMLNLIDSFCKCSMNWNVIDLEDDELSQLDNYFVKAKSINDNLLHILQVLFNNNHACYLIPLVSKLKMIQF